MKKILTFSKDIAEYYTTTSKDLLTQHNITIVYCKRNDLSYNEEILGLINGTLTLEELDLLPNLKWVIVPYTGLNGLDLEELEVRGIEVYNTSAHGHFVAERALALILALMGKLVEFHNGLRKGNWGNRLTNDRIYWHSLFNKKVGILGYGTIGKTLKSLLEPFGCEVGVVAYKKRKYEDLTTLETIEDLAKWCDLIVVAAPLTDQTKKLFDKKLLTLMKDKYLINIGRGGIVEEKALYDSLLKDELAGYGSDVWYTYPSKDVAECQPSNYPIHEMEQVVMTPHNAGFEATSRKLRYDDVLRQIIDLTKE